MILGGLLMMAVTNAEQLTKRIQELREAQKVFATYTQEQVDEIFRAAAMAANNSARTRCPPCRRWRPPAWP